MEEERLRVRQEELARLRVEFAMSVAAEGPAAEGAEGVDEEGDVGAPDGVVAVLDGESGGPAEVQNEVPENAMEPEAKDFDPEVFLSVRGYESVAAPTGEVNGDGSPGPVDVPEVVVAEPEVSEPEGVQEIPGTGGGDFDDAGFVPVDEKWFPCRRLMAAMLWARGRMLATLKSLVRWSPMSLWLLRWWPVAAGGGPAGECDDAVLAEVSQLPGLGAEGGDADLPGLGAVVIEEGDGGLELGEVLHTSGNGDPLEVGLYVESGERPARFGRRPK